MPPTTKLKKFRDMLQNEASDLTKALNELFKNPISDFAANHPNAVNVIMNTPDCFDPISAQPDLVTVLTDALNNVNNGPYNPPDIPKVFQHIDDWSNTIPAGQAKVDVQAALKQVLNPAINVKDMKVKWKWNMFSGPEPDYIEINIDIQGGIIQNPVEIRFWNSTDRTEVTVM
jgi:hypothetical protein